MQSPHPDSLAEEPQARSVTAARNQMAHLAHLLDLAPVAAVVRAHGTDTITYWSRGAEQLYGWTADEAVGKVIHVLFQTEFPESQAHVDGALSEVGHWAGELVHTRIDGQRIVVASRQAVQRDELGRPVATLQLDIDLSRNRGLESDLRASDERFRLLVEAVKDYAIFLLSPQGLVLTWNEGAQRVKQYQAHEIVGQSFTRFYPPEDVERGLPYQLLATAEADGRAEHEGWRVRKDGSRFWADVVITALRDERGALQGFAKITRDLTERREAEEARARASREEGARAAAEAAQAEVRASRDQLAAILASVAEGITVLDSGGRMLYANEAAARLCGFESAAELLAATREEILSRFDIVDETGGLLSVDRMPTRVALQGGVPQPMEVRFRIRATGEERWSSVSATPIRDEAGRVTMAVNVFRDITERKRAEDSARLLAAINLELTRTLDFELTLRRLAELAVPTLGDWCVVDLLDDTGELRRLATAHVDPAKVDLARTLSERYPPDPRARGGVHEVIRTGRSQLLTEIADAQLQAAARDPDHHAVLKTLQLRSAIVVPLVARGRSLGAITLVAAESGRRYTPRDLAFAEDLAVRAGLAIDNARLYREAQDQATTHVELNTALRHALDQLERELRTRDEFLAAASHDLKNPIAAMKGTAQVLLRRLTRTIDFDIAQAREPLERIVAVATRAAAQVDDLLDTARMEMGRPLDLDREDVELVQLTRELILEHQQLTERHELRLDAHLPSLVAPLDGRRFARAVGNLLDNAVKYSPDGGVVRVEVAVDEAEPGWAVIAVHDQGVGIPTEDLELIFERFERGSNVVGAIAGTGIGLASARHIVESHGGTIRVESKPGNGSSFTIRLPLERAVADVV